jgi:hypothetical protein
VYDTPKCKWNENFKQISKTNIVTSSEGLHLNQKKKKKKVKKRYRERKSWVEKRKKKKEEGHST